MYKNTDLFGKIAIQIGKMIHLAHRRAQQTVRLVVIVQAILEHAGVLALVVVVLQLGARRLAVRLIRADAGRAGRLAALAAAVLQQLCG